MPRVRTEVELDEPSLVAALRPRDDALVRERIDGDPGPDADRGAGGDRAADGDGPPDTGRATLSAADGPFRSYRRTVDWRRLAGADGTRFAVGTTVDYRLAIPYWSALFDLVVRRRIGEGIPPGVTPWWSTPDRLSPSQSTTVAAMAMFNLVAGMLYGLLTQVLTFVSADLGDGSAGEQAAVLSVVRVGVVITVVVMFLADRRGRRRVAVWSLAAAGALTVVTALAPSLWAVAALQFVARNLAIAGLLCVDTITVEEVPPGSRAMVTGLGALAYGLGAGVVVVSLPLADLGPWGWRLTFVVTGLSLPLVWHARRHLPESGRFRRLRSADALDAATPLATAGPATTASRPSPADDARPPVESRRVSRARLVLIGSMFFLVNVFVAPSSQLQNDYLRVERDYSGFLITLFTLATATPAGLGVLAGGRLADIRGRRVAIIAGMLCAAVFTVTFFSLGGPPMWAAQLGAGVLGTLAVPALGVIAPELFPTAHRGGVRGVLTAIAVVGSVTGLLSAGWLIGVRDYSTAFALLAVAPVAAALLALAIPETRGRELEDLNR